MGGGGGRVASKTSLVNARASGVFACELALLLATLQNGELSYRVERR